MSAEELLARLTRMGITVELEGADRLAIEGPDDRVEAEIETIRKHKPQIISYLRTQRSETASSILTRPATPARAEQPVRTVPVSGSVPAMPAAAPAAKAAKPAPAPKPRIERPKFRLPQLPDFRALASGAAAGARSRLAAVAAGTGELATSRVGLAFQRVAATLQPVEASPRVLAGALPFQSDLTEIIEEPPPRHMRMTAWLLAGFLLLAVLIASIVEIDVVVRGSGKLTADGPPLVVQPIERAILRSLHVKPGDFVTKGQVVATLDPTFAEADVTAIDTQERIVASQLRRLEAEAREEPLLPDTGSPEENLQLDILRQRRQEYMSRLKAFDEDLKRSQAAYRTVEVERTLLEQQLIVARDVEQMRTTLLANQSGSRLQYLEARSVRIRAERDFQAASDRLVELKHELDSKRAERQAFVDEWRRRLFEEIERLRGESARISGALAKARRFKELVVINAPEDGVVIDVAKRSVGSVLKDAESLMTLAPTNLPLIAEVALASADVGYAKAGDTVIVKVDTFPYTRHGTLKGRLRAISQESFAPGDGPIAAGLGSFHKAQVELTDLRLDKLPEGARLIPGLTVSADIKVGMRTIISYFLTPLVRGFDESLREP